MKRCLAIVAVTAAALAASESHAQSGFASSELNRLQSVSKPAAYSATAVRNSAVSSAVPRYSFAGVNPGLLGNALGRPNKPFASISKGPSVTPYLALDNPFTSPATSYYTQIRPQLEQQRVNDQLARQTQLLQRQMGEVTSQAPYDPSGAENRAPTGHASVYMNYGGYYTTPQPPKRR